MDIYWDGKLDEFGRNLVRFCGADPAFLPSDRNPITDGLRDPTFLDRLEAQPWFSKRSCRAAMSRAATICQMEIYDAQGGPDYDRERKGLRRHWYSWYKVDFAQRLSAQLGETDFDGILWAGRMSKTYAHFVDKENLTYFDLWVKDASRMMRSFSSPLYQGANFVFAVEKDSLFEDFIAAAAAMGCTALISGKGKQSKAATEKMLRDHFFWRESSDGFGDDTPLVFVHLSDHDFDGEAVIGPTFGDQADRYTPYVMNERVGIRPADVPQEDWPVKWFGLKMNNSGYIDWALQEGLYMGRCQECEWYGPLYRAVDLDAESLHKCPRCGENVFLAVKDDADKFVFIHQPHGFEVEAMPTRTYYPLAVDALLRVVSFDHIVGKLRDECRANPWTAAGEILGDVLDENSDYQDMLEEFKRLDDIKQAFESEIEQMLYNLGSPHQGDWRDLEDDPESNDFREYVAEADRYTGPWRPFDSDLRTEKLVDWLREEAEDDLATLAERTITWIHGKYQALVDASRGVLEEIDVSNVVEAADNVVGVLRDAVIRAEE